MIVRLPCSGGNVLKNHPAIDNSKHPARNHWSLKVKICESIIVGKGFFIRIPYTWYSVCMQIDTIILVVGMIIGFGIVGYLVHKNNTPKTDEKALANWLQSMQRSIEHTNATLQETLRMTQTDTHRALTTQTKDINERLDTASQVMGELKKNLGELSEVGRGIKDLQMFLQSPKLRGELGEEILADTIAQLFPKQSFHLQYSFKTGAKVDAAIKTDGGLLPIDAKFPMSNFIMMHTAELLTERSKAKREFGSDVKKHMMDISKKYILPDEGTLDFALMYVPSESVYYEIVSDAELMKLAKRLRIYPVSPNTLYAHLQVLLVSFQGKELEKRTHEVMRLLRSISTDYTKIVDQYTVLTKHVSNAYSSTSTVSFTLQQLGNKLSQTEQLTDGEKT